MSLVGASIARCGTLAALVGGVAGLLGTMAVACSNFDANVPMTGPDAAESDSSIAAQDGGLDDDSVIARDAFERTISSGFGTADVGGTWNKKRANQGGMSSYVKDGVGVFVGDTGGQGGFARLDELDVDDVDVSATFSLSRIPDGAGTYLMVATRAPDDFLGYHAKLILRPGELPRLIIDRTLTKGVDVPLADDTLPGLTVSADDRIRIRTQVVGRDERVVRARAWKVGEAEPANWTEAKDSFAGMAASGAVGVTVYPGASAQISQANPVLFRVDDVVATKLLNGP